MVITDKFFSLSAQKSRRPAPPHNPHAARILTAPPVAQRHPRARIGEYPSAEAFLFAYDDNKCCDILLADIEMDGIDGVEMAERVRQNDDLMQIVFITGYPDYMSRGYDVSALHYLLKPLAEEKLYEVLDRAMKNIEKKGRRIILSTADGEWATTLDAILYTESSLHNIRIYARDGVHEVRMTLSALRAQFDDRFVVTHRSYTVNLSHAVSILKGEIVLDSGDRIPVSRGEWQQVRRAFVEYNKGELE